ncbi:MAG: prenyltransferase [Verrucomicrobia bacterium]|jgi:4-hydroxybenzoate polyprenyltransferase|nr:prenyltransferase [Verrucomicrobiota bacterium]
MENVVTNPPPPLWRTLLILGRVSNLPTVWSNCAAGWLLGGQGEMWKLLLLCLGATFFYVGGMYLNDACDAEFDRQYRQERPVPSGAISVTAVYALGFGGLLAGLIIFLLLGKTVAIFGLILGISILLYDLVHKFTVLSPVLMALCRLFLFLAAVAVGEYGINGFAVWCAVVLACYIIGLSYIAKQESSLGILRFWPSIFLAAPVVLAYIINGPDYRLAGLWFSALLIGWVIWCLRFTFWSPERNIGRTVSGLLAGIVLVDLLAIAGGSSPVMTVVFLLLFGAALVFQKFVPAT